MILCDIHNPTGGRRTFYDGLGSPRPISIDPGETKTGVQLAEHVVALLKRAIRPDLKITEREAGEPTPVCSLPVEPKSEPEPPRRRGRPPGASATHFRGLGLT
jgi:hypothetical protein